MVTVAKSYAWAEVRCGLPRRDGLPCRNEERKCRWHGTGKGRQRALQTGSSRTAAEAQQHRQERAQRWARFAAWHAVASL